VFSRRSDKGKDKLHVTEIHYPDGDKAPLPPPNVNTNPVVTPLDHGYVYFVRNAEGLVKIGKSNDPVQRIKALQTGNPKPLETICILHVAEAHRSEAWFHKFYEHKNVNLEWYALDDNDIERLKHLHGNYIAWIRGSYEVTVTAQQRTYEEKKKAVLNYIVQLLGWMDYFGLLFLSFARLVIAVLVAVAVLVCFYALLVIVDMNIVNVLP